MKLVSGTRESELAMMQTTYVNKLLTEANPDLEIDVLSMTTKGTVIIVLKSRQTLGSKDSKSLAGPRISGNQLKLCSTVLFIRKKAIRF